MRHLNIESDLSQLPLLYDFCEELGLPPQVMLALEEAFVNVVSYSGASYFDLKVDLSETDIVMVLEDDGVEFNPASYFAPDDNAARLSVGGQGIRIIRSLMDTMRYVRENDRNILTLVKSLKN